jgi:inositol-phosphate phosphatase/L-galactose 1-phosphate phosphatase/histidinol-phosphatase
MILSKELQKRFRLAMHLADLSAGILRKYYRRNNLIELKEDASPVTEIDRTVELVLKEKIRKVFPLDGIVAEEFGQENESAKVKWIIDPIDGTKSFIEGKPIFTTLIGVQIENQPFISVVSQGVLKEKFYAVKSKGAFLKKKRLQVSTCENISLARFATTSPYLFNKSDTVIIKKIADASKVVSYGGDAYNYAMLCCGFIDVVIESGLKPYDIIPLITLITEAGGVITDFEGNDLSKIIALKNQYDVIVTSTKALNKQIINDFFK